MLNFLIVFCLYLATFKFSYSCLAAMPLSFLQLSFIETRFQLRYLETLMSLLRAPKRTGVCISLRVCDPCLPCPCCSACPSSSVFQTDKRTTTLLHNDSEKVPRQVTAIRIVVAIAGHGQRGIKRGAAEKMRGLPRRAWSRKICTRRSP